MKPGLAFALACAVLPGQHLSPAAGRQGWFALDGRPVLLMGVSAPALSFPAGEARPLLDNLLRAGGNLLRINWPDRVEPRECAARLRVLLEQARPRRIVIALPLLDASQEALAAALGQPNVLWEAPPGDEADAAAARLFADAASAGQVPALRRVAVRPEPGESDGIDEFWRELLNGAPVAALRMEGLDLSGRAAAAIRAARMISTFTPLWEYQARGEALLEIPAGGAYAAARREDAFLVYLPQGGAVTVAAGDTPYAVVWISVDTAEIEGHAHPIAGGILELKAPRPGRWLALVSH